MATLFFDTSALCKYYESERGTDNVTALLSSKSNKCFVSRLAVVEMFSAFAKRVRSKASSAEGFSAVASRFNADVSSGKLFRTMKLTSLHLEEAERLLRCYALIQNLRTLDSLQLASAIILHKLAGLDAIICSDNSLACVAAMEGFLVVNPEHDIPK